MPEGSRCDFNKGVCGWKVPSQIPTKSGYVRVFQARAILQSLTFSRPRWKIYKGKSELGDIDGDINFQHPSMRKNGKKKTKKGIKSCYLKMQFTAYKNVLA